MKGHRYTKEETRARITDQADALFRQFGYSKTTVADIARELKMSTANIYKFFPSKSAIIQAGAERNLSELNEIILRVVRSKKRAGDRLLGIVLAIYRLHQDYFKHERQIYQLVRTATEENWSCVCDFKKFLNRILVDVIRDGIRQGEFRRTDAAATTSVLLDCFTWITNPVLFPDLVPGEVEKRARAQVRLLEKALQ